MKNKKGFTLVELLGTLVVLSVILMIAYPLVTSYVKNTKQKAYDTQMEIMLTSLRNHANEYKDILPINDKEYVLLKLGQLKGLGVIKNSVINPLNGEEIEDSMEFKISKEGTRYVYEILENTIETRASKDSSPSIELIGNPLEYYEVGAVYEEKGVKAYDYNGNSLDITTTTTLDMNTDGIYTILYSVIDENNIKSYAYRTIIVGSGIDRVYEDGEVVYFNPITNSACKESDYDETTNSALEYVGTKENGCMKWYAFLDAKGAPTVKLLLDHNTTASVMWKNGGTTPDTALAALYEDITGWDENVKSTARLISAVEVNRIAPTASGFTWIQSDYMTYYYFHTGTSNSYRGSVGTNKYAWLFDNLERCNSYGCNRADSGTSTYWTSSFASTGVAWCVYYDGSLANLSVADPTPGVRPVIEVSKMVLE